MQREIAAMFGFGKKKKQDEKAAEKASADASEKASAVAAPAPVARSPKEKLPPSSGLMAGAMQTPQRNLADILEYAALYHAQQEVVSILPGGEGPHRETYAQMLVRTKKLANALQALGVSGGDRVATLAWNTHRHVEAWYAISGQGAICHTVNPRLYPEQIVYIINHAKNRVVFYDITFAPLIDAIRDHLTTVENFVCMTSEALMPANGDHCFETLIRDQSDEFTWPRFDEDTASSLCYTSGTTGDPKGVLYSHRSNLLMAAAISQKDIMNMGTLDAALMVVPMFHANSWGMAYGVPLVGAKLILPGMALDGENVHRLIKEENVTVSAAVPTVWQGLLAFLEKTGSDLKPLREVMIGGAAAPRSMIDIFDAKYGVDVIHAWGMTEMSPLGTVNRLTPSLMKLDREKRLDYKTKQGRPPYGVELKIVNEEGVELARDGVAAGQLLCRGPWIAKSYFGREDNLLDAEGWFDTGDIATLDPHGYMQITDRAKDVIKSGGEWISSVDMENLAVSHPDVLIAAAIGVPDAKWGERPRLLVKMKEGASLDKESLIELLAGAFAKWQLPDEIIVVDEIPLTATGKIDKKVLRKKYGEQG
jgi:acyl-CoA synthetase (AMP-forming)/AMP-acid ligase II